MTPSSTSTPSPRDSNPQRHPSVVGNRVSSRELLDADGMLIIQHGGRDYQLRETRNGKLILTS